MSDLDISFGWVGESTLIAIIDTHEDKYAFLGVKGEKFWNTRLSSAMAGITSSMTFKHDYGEYQMVLSAMAAHYNALEEAADQELKAAFAANPNETDPSLN